MAAKSSSVELVANLAAKAAQIPSLRAVRLEADYIPARLPSGLVTGIWGTALIRTPDGDLRELVIGDEIRKGDVIMTSQNGIVEIEDAGTRLARFPGTDALEQILTDLPPTGAGLTGGDPGSLLPGVRVDRINESVDGQAFAFSAAERAQGQAFTAAPEDTALPSLTVSNPTITEGSGFAVFTVTLTSPNTQGTTVVLSTNDGTATGGGVDYGTTEVSTDGGVTWTPGSSAILPPGTNDVLVRVPVTNDTVHEPVETFTLDVSTPSATVPGGSVTTTATATIVDDDPTPTVVSVTPGTTDTNGDGIADVLEGTGAGNGNPVTYSIVMSNASSLPLTYSFSLAGTGTNQADPASDLAPTITFTNGVVRSADGSTITVPANVLGFSISVTTNPDAIDEENETFNVNVGGVFGTVSIIDDDALTVIDLNGPAVGNARALVYTENDPATPIAPALTLVDPDSNTISRAIVSITGGFAPSEDALAFTAVNGIASSYDASTGVLTFTGAGTLAQYQALLQSVTYVNSSDDPSAATRTVSYVVFDELDRSSPPALATVNVIPVNDAPTNLPVELTPIVEDSGARLITQAELLANARDLDDTLLTALGLAVTAGTGTLVDNGNGTWTYTPALNDDTGASFSYSVSDGSLTVPGSATLDITPVNDAPVSGPVALTPIAEDSGARLITQAQLLANATDVDNANLTATGLTVTAGTGTLVDNGNGTWTYTPALNDDTGASFSYTVSDGSLTVAGSATLDITPVNDAPVNSPVTLVAIAEDGGTRLITQAELLANATDVDNATLTAVGLTVTAGNGTLVDNGNGTWNYTPALNDDTSVSFSYSVSDGSLNVAGSATLDITPVNDAPINSPVTLAPIAEDSGARVITQAQLLANATDVDNANLIATGLTVTAGTGTLVDNGNGTWTYTPLLNDDTGASFSYSVSDGTLAVAGSATLDITPVNDAPVTGPVTLAPIAEDSNARLITQVELLANATDVDNATLTATGLTLAAGNGTLVDNGNGTWTYTPALNDDTSASFSYSVSDGTLAVPGSATLDITPVNDAPVNSPVTLAPIAEDSGVRLITQAQLLVNASDVDSAPLTAAGLTLTAGIGTLVNNGNGTWNYTPALNDDTSVSFSYTVSDGSLTVPGLATLDITPVDDAPINNLPNPTTNLPGLTANEDSALFFSAANGNAITVFDADIVNDAGTLTTTVSVAQGTFTLGSTSAITVVGNSNGSSSVTFTGTPTAINAALNGSSYRNVPDFFTHNSNGGFIDSNGIGLTITTTDSTNLTGADSTNLVIRAVTDIQIVTRVTNESQTTTPFTLASLINPNDVGSGFEGTDAAITSINGTAVAAGGTLVVANGTVHLIGNQSLEFTPNAGFTATAENPASFTYTVASGGRTETAAFFVQVDPLALPAQTTPGVAASNADPIQSINAFSAPPISTTADVLTGTAGSDVFAWHLGDAGTASTPHAYRINNFDGATASDGGDVLDLRDLLVGENANNLGAFLDFSKSGTDTVIAVSSNGNGQVDQTITLTNLDLAASIGLAPDASEAQMITALINQGKLMVDATV